ncbi:MAG TPA: hypothetical protein VFS21_18660 [Roseiflexaceae bacterium]|nr:hypothetical protein [Roseiflexaceae bacterium]
MSWSGTTQCLVVNGTLGPITGVQVTHKLGDNSQSTPLTTLNSLETYLFSIEIGSGHDDEWTVSFTTDNGTQVQGSAGCNIEEEDDQAAACVIVALYDTSIGFSIFPPVSRPLLHVSYDLSTADAADPAGAELLQNWSGPMGCLVVNASGGPISDVQIAHMLGDTPQSPPVGAMANYGTLLYTITSSADNTDKWSVSFVTADNVTVQQSDKECKIEAADYQANSCVIIALYNAYVGFSIITPVSDPCLQNGYQ